jgi:hypothetical protein
MRVNARLDEQTSLKIEYLTQATGQSVSHVVREAIAVYHVQVRGKQSVPSRFLALAGKGDSGRSDIASNVKEAYFDALMAKHRPERVRR